MLGNGKCGGYYRFLHALCYVGVAVVRKKIYFDTMSEKISRTLLTLSAAWAVIGLTSGVVFRELTRHNDADPGVLSLVHGHTLVLGMIFMLLALLLHRQFLRDGLRSFTVFIYTWNIGLLLTVGTLFVRGLRTLGSMEHSAALAGIAGLGHIALTVGLFFFFRALFVATRTNAQ